MFFIYNAVLQCGGAINTTILPDVVFHRAIDQLEVGGGNLRCGAIIESRFVATNRRIDN
jgi:hypothetical protein